MEPIAREIVHWKAYTKYLGVSRQEEAHIDAHPKHGLSYARPQMMLEAWQDTWKDQPKSNYRYLLRGFLEKEGNAGLVERVCEIITLKGSIKAKGNFA